MAQRKLLVISFIMFLIIASGCKNEKDERVEIHIAAASNLVQAFTELGTIYEKDHNVKIVFSFGSSGQLTEQIINGAPFDAFAPASAHFFESILEQGLLSGEQPIFALGRIGVATNKDSNISISSLEDLLLNDIVKIGIANPEHAPYGMAAKEALQQAGIWNPLEKKIVYGRNIADTLTLLETKNVEAAIIALSLKDEKLNFLDIDETMHKPLEHPISKLTTSKYEAETERFIQFLFSEKGKEILVKYGYSTP